MNILDLARPEIRALKPYSSARMEASGGTVLLNANESPWPAAFDISRALNRYPDPQPAQLVAKLGELYGVDASRVLVGRGSDEAIDLLVRAFCRAGEDAIAIAPPTFGMYAVSAAVQGARIVEVPLREDFSLDADVVLAAIDARVKLVFVCTPNNPTGNLVPLATIERLTKALADRALIVVDEAYLEFAQAPSAATLLDHYPNLVVLRTLSKAHALAGARIGTLLADAEIVALLKRILPAYPLPTPCIAAALAALQPDALAVTRARIAALIGARERLAQALRLPPEILDVMPSSANFLVVRCTDAATLYRRLLADGIVVRDVSRYRGMANCLRISIGSDTDNARLLAVLNVHEAAA